MAKKTKRLRTFHATMHVTRIEHWTIEAPSEDEARAQLGSLKGDCSHIGETLHYEIDSVIAGD